MAAELADALHQVAGVLGGHNEQQRAYTLLHADWRVKEEEVVDLKAKVSQLEALVSDMKDTYATARKQIREAREAEHM